MKVATASIDLIWEDKKKNAEICEDFIRISAENLADIVIFPELTLTGFSSENSDILAEEESDSRTFDFFGRMAKKYSINVIFGMYLKSDKNQRPRNTMCLSDRNGITKVLFSKVHLFSYSNEDKYLSSGTAIATQVIDGVSFGFAICYDLRFPELFSLMSKDCQVIVVIANWPFERSKQWDALLTARAIENECILVGVNRTGIDGNGVQYKKTSMVVMPNGEKMDPVIVDSEIDIYSIKKSVVNNFRKIFPTVDDKKFGLYSQKYKNYQRDI